MDADDRAAAKRRAGERAAEAVEDGMVVGLGTGSTAAYAIRAIGRAVDAGLDVRGVPTSYGARAIARQAGVPLTDLDSVDRVDLAIDGADQIAGDELGLVKGGGAAHAREKVVAAASEAFLVVVDESKMAAELDAPIPVEVLPSAWSPVAAAIGDLGGEATLRDGSGKDGPVVSDNGNLVGDGDFGAVTDPEGINDALSRIPGLVEHGLFVGMADAVYVGTGDGVSVRRPGD